MSISTLRLSRKAIRGYFLAAKNNHNIIDYIKCNELLLIVVLTTLSEVFGEQNAMETNDRIIKIVLQPGIEC